MELINESLRIVGRSGRQSTGRLNFKISYFWTRPY